MSLESVRAYLKRWDVDGRILEFSESSATVPEAAAAVGCSEGEIAKSMSLKVKDEIIVVVTAGDMRIDNPKYKARFHTKAVLLKMDEVEEMTGHPVGGVCPFALKEGVRVYLDESLKRFDKVYPACGTRNSAIGLTLEELERYSGSEGWVDVCKA